AMAAGLVAARAPGETVPRVTIIEIIAFVFAVFTLYGCGAEPVLYGVVLLVLGIPVYVWQRRRAGSSGAPSGRQIPRHLIQINACCASIPFSNGAPKENAMEFFKAFPIAIIDEDYEGKQAAGRGMRQLAEAIEKEGFRVVAGVSYADAKRLAEVFNNEACWLVSID